MTQQRAWIFGGVVLAFLFLGVFLGVSLIPSVSFPFTLWSGDANPHDTPQDKSEEWATVSRVIDGDTIELDTREKVRYIGINTPESVDPRRKVECFGKEASSFNKNLVEGKTVRLEKDISDRDKYGRLLRFVYLEDGTFINEVLVREGYAYASPYTPDVSKKELFREAEFDARIHTRGLWSPDTCDGKK